MGGHVVENRFGSLALQLPLTIRKENAVFGWMILFASIAGLGGITMATGNALSTSERMATALFLVLFIIGLLTRVARGRAW